MSEVDSLKIVPLSALEKGGHYQIRAKAQLSKLTLPLYLHYVLFFVSLWDFETDSNFKRVSGFRCQIFFCDWLLASFFDRKQGIISQQPVTSGQWSDT